MTTAAKPHRLLKRGWSLVPIPAGGKACFLEEWQRFCERQPTSDDLDAWCRRWPGHGYGIPLGPNLLAVDSDADDQEVQALITLARLEYLGETPLIREGRPGRWLALYQLSKPLPAKVKAGPVDLLTGGAQVVGWHIHPDTRRPYRWLHGDPHDIGPADLPVVTPEQVEGFRQALLRELPPRPITIRAGAPHGALHWTTDDRGFVVDGREAFLTRCVLRACWETRDARAATEIAWRRFCEGAELTRPHGHRPWSREQAERKVRATLRRIEQGQIALAQPQPALPPAQIEEDLAPTVARDRLASEVEAFVRKGLAGEGFNLGIAATVGLGKSEVTLDVLARLAAGQTVWFFVPTHQLAAELAAKAEARGLPTTVIRGRDQLDPAEANMQMCRKADVAAAVARAGHEVWSSLCELERDDDTVERCPHFATCPYVQQWSATSGRLVIFAHTYLRLPKARAAKPDLIVVDERFWPELAQTRSLPVERLDAPRSETRMIPAEVVAEHLHAAAAVKRALLEGRPVQTSGIAADELREMAKRELQLAASPTIRPGLSLAEQKNRATRLAEAEAFRLRRLWLLLAEDHERNCPNQRVHVRRGVPWRGELQDRVFLHWRSPLELPAGVPILLLDADLDPRIAAKLLPLKRTVTIRARLNAEVVQVFDTACSKRRLIGYPGAPEEEQRRAANRLADVRALAMVEAARGRKVVVGASKAVRERLELPAGTEVLHFGAIRGLDAFKGYDTIIIAGREQPSPEDIEDQARALFGDDPEPLNLTGNYVQEVRGYRLHSGAHQGAKVAVHPDPRVQALLEQVREREIEQMVGRLRLVHRAQPARVFLLSNVPTGLLIHRPATWTDVIPGKLAQAAARGAGVLPLSASELARLYPDLWATARAVDQWRVREAGKGTRTPIEDSYWETCTLSEATVVTYRRPGQSRGSPHRAILPGVVEDAATAEDVLAALVGQIEQVRVVEVVRRPGAEPLRPVTLPATALHPVLTRRMQNAFHDPNPLVYSRFWFVPEETEAPALLAAAQAAVNSSSIINAKP